MRLMLWSLRVGASWSTPGRAITCAAPRRNCSVLSSQRAQLADGSSLVYEPLSVVGVASLYTTVGLEVGMFGVGSSTERIWL